MVTSHSRDSGLVEAIEAVYKKVETKYVYQSDDQWIMKKGFGFI